MLMAHMAGTLAKYGIYLHPNGVIKIDGDRVVGGVSSFCPYTHQTYLDPQGRHVAMFVAQYSDPAIKTLAFIHGVGVHQ
ncbi:hypothetical protein SBP1_gp092 [Vibrio virus vB_VspP_SBP1]|uniref:Uncharacterized protein n=1 Tax=Vibrio virus vB_VspP_SBP1 TaxID=2500581 RepID=A0A3T0IIU5_9CAUD|nr:hypothetical protein KNU36_gp037 [Vibrio virus vB_VspP_SBP1]AZU99684.1 hypothetical protein SBP1_gp092 [Vibrio virus vB_VspP_SBP1]